MPFEVNQPIAEVREGAGQEVVACEDRAQSRKALEGGVGGEHEDGKGEALHGEEPGRLRRPRREHGARHPDMTDLAAGPCAGLEGEHRHAQKEHDRSRPGSRGSPRRCVPVAA